MDETMLIESAREGDLDAFNHLVLNYQDQVYHHSFSILSEQEAAEDVTQEVFIRAFRAMKRFRGGSMRAWLLRIATNACYDELRRRKHTDNRRIIPEENENEVDFMESIASQEASAEEQVEQVELSLAIQRGLAELPLEYRLVAELVDVLGLGYAEAAASLGIPQGTVKSRLSRARQGLRARLLRSPELLPRSMLTQRM